jgi:hypothetical protein
MARPLAPRQLAIACPAADSLEASNSSRELCLIQAEA